MSKANAKLWVLVNVLLAGASASALAQSSASGQVEEVEVTATRVQREGFTAPTPTTVLTKEQLQLGGTLSIGEALTYLPSQVNATAPATTSGNTTGVSYFANLRGLGQTRTLTLINGQRPVPTDDNQFDLSLIPLSMVKSIDTVTGGASAAWGSDAVAGVINIILDDKFDGLRANAQYGAPFDYGGGTSYKVDFALGGSFGTNDRGHYLIGGEYLDTQGIGPREKSLPVQYGYIANPNYTGTGTQPSLLLVHNPAYAIASQGGLVLNGPLAGTAFGPGGTPYQFQFGQYNSGLQMAGGGAGTADLFGQLDLVGPIREKSLMGNFTYDVTDSVKLRASVIYGSTTTSDSGIPNYSFGTIVINSGNPFIPAATQAQMTALGQSALVLGRYNFDFGTLYLNTQRNLLQGTVGASGNFGANWTWDVYASYGRTQNNNTDGPQLINDLFAQSLDAVTSPTTGKPICRVALTNPTSACVPVNIFGYGSPSKAALSYFLGASLIDTTLSRDDVAGTIKGTPFSTWAGPVSIAAGGEFRRDAEQTTYDPISGAGRFDFLNGNNFGGAYSVGEGFVEAVVPLLADVVLAKNLDFNGAFRMSEYSNAGQQKTWKLGLVDKVTDEILVRGTLSQDLRAPSISELYAPAGIIIGNITNPFNNSTTIANTYTGGNSHLQPETAHTLTYGVAYSPAWVPGLQMSVDYYNIDIHNEIGALSGQQIANFCFQGQTQLCSLITPNPLTTPGGGTITSISTQALNLAKGLASGLDIEAAYRFDLATIDPSLDGSLSSHLLVNYVDKLTTVTGVLLQQQAGTLSGTPRWTGVLSESYAIDQWKFDLRVRYFSGMEVSNQNSSNYNHFSDYTYFDFGTEYAITPDRQFVVYANLQNVFDKQAPLAMNSQNGANFYDPIGRAYNVGVRVNF